jgi:Domain of unknown function (DUF4836)
MKFTPLLTAASALVLLASCNRAVSGLPIPKDATFVADIHTSSLLSKLSWDDIKKSDWFQELYQKSTDTLAKQLADHPEMSGVDFRSDFAFFMKKQPNGAYTVFEGKLSNASAFETFVKKVSHADSVEKNGDIRFVLASGQHLISWNQSEFIVVMDAPALTANSPMSGLPGSEGLTRSFPMDSLKAFSKGLFELSSSASLNSDDRFMSIVKEPGDLHLWLNADEYTNGIGGGAMSLLKINSLLQGNAAGYTVNFEDGRITAKAKSFLGKDMQALVAKFDVKPLPASLFNRIPSKDVVGVMAANYPPQAIKEFLAASGMDGLANSFLAKLNTSLDELIKPLGGQMMVAVTDFTINKTMHAFPGSTDSFPSTSPSVKYLFALSINDKQSFDRVLGIAKARFGDSTLQSSLNLRTTNDWFTLSNSAPFEDGFLSGTSGTNPVAEKLAGHPFGMYVNIQRIMTGMEPMMTDSLSKGSLETSKKMWQDIVATGGEYKDGVGQAEFVVNLVDHSTNSLKQLHQYAGNLYTIQKKREAMIEQHMPSDSVALPSMPPAEPLPSPSH